MKNRLKLITAVAALSLAGCSTGPADGPQDSELQPDASARATLDYETSTIVTPVSEYSLSSADSADIVRAREAVIGRCMLAKGQQNDTEATGGQDEDRPYGIWNVDRAKRYGFDLVGENDSAINESDPTWIGVREQCVNDVAAELDGLDESKGAVEQIENTAREYVRKSDLYRQLQDEYRACVEKKGLKFAEDDPDAWAVEQESELLDQQGNREALLRVAVDEAQCNTDIGATQALSDLEAGYQMPLIAESEAALKQEAENNAKALVEAQKILNRAS